MALYRLGCLPMMECQTDTSEHTVYIEQQPTVDGSDVVEKCHVKDEQNIIWHQLALMQKSGWLPYPFCWDLWWENGHLCTLLNYKGEREPIFSSVSQSVCLQDRARDVHDQSNKSDILNVWYVGQAEHIWYFLIHLCTLSVFAWACVCSVVEVGGCPPNTTPPYSNPPIVQSSLLSLSYPSWNQHFILTSSKVTPFYFF